MGITLDSSRLEVLHLLAFQASLLRMPLYLVGGVVRDILLGRTVRDFDLMLEGNSAEFAEYIVRKFGGKILIHSKFGTATWILNESTFKRLNVPAPQFSESTLSFDFISARSEYYEYPGALPTVKPSTVDDDLHRRDFTINAMALRLDADFFGDLVDPLDGRKDLENKLIRALHERSFVDDPTRMFRAVRYAERYQFEIASETLRLINKGARTVLAKLSGERLRHEIDMVFEEEHPAAIFEKLNVLDLISVVHPAMSSADTQWLTSLIEKPAEEFGELVIPDILSFRQTLGWVFYLLNLPEAEIESIGRRLAFPLPLSRAARGASVLNKTISSFTDWRPSQWTLYLDELPSLAVYAVWLATFEPALREYFMTWRNIKPFTSGYTLQGRGLAPGPRYKEILSRLRAAWLDGKIKNEEEETRMLNQLMRSMGA